jgi:hypothetical protein
MRWLTKVCSSDHRSEVGEGGREAQVCRSVGGEFVVATRRFRTNAWPAAIPVADRNCFSPRIGRGRA